MDAEKTSIEKYSLEKLLQSMEGAKWEGVESLFALSSSLRAARVLTSRVEAKLLKFGLNWPRFEALVMLRYAEGGSLLLGQLSHRLLVHPTSVTNIVDKLEAEGLVRRVPHSEDRRAVLAQITEEGHELMKSAAKALHEIEYGFAGASKEQLHLLIIACIEFGFTVARDESVKNFDESSMETLLEFLQDMFRRHSTIEATAVEAAEGGDLNIAANGTCRGAAKVDDAAESSDSDFKANVSIA